MLKNYKKETQVTVDFAGFIIPDKFVIGYGLDYLEYGRNLRDIYCSRLPIK